jgi:hypothetical protein
MHKAIQVDHRYVLCIVCRNVCLALNIYLQVFSLFVCWVLSIIYTSSLIEICTRVLNLIYFYLCMLCLSLKNLTYFYLCVLYLSKLYEVQTTIFSYIGLINSDYSKVLVIYKNSMYEFSSKFVGTFLECVYFDYFPSFSLRTYQI